MRQNRRSATAKSETRATPEQIVKNIHRATRKHRSAEENIRIVLEGLRGEYSIAKLCRREGISVCRSARDRKKSAIVPQISLRMSAIAKKHRPISAHWRVGVDFR